jgi:hypothetical protein
MPGSTRGSSNDPQHCEQSILITSGRTVTLTSVARPHCGQSRVAVYRSAGTASYRDDCGLPEAPGGRYGPLGP